MRQYVQGYGQGIKTRESLRDLGRRRGVVGGDLLDEGQELAVERDDDPFLAHLADGPAHRHVEVDGRHDAVAEFLMDQSLDCRSVDTDDFIDFPGETTSLESAASMEVGTFACGASYGGYMINWLSAHLIVIGV